MDKSLLIIISIILCGYLYAIFDKEKLTEEGLNKYLYYFALPLTIFYNTVLIDFSSLTINFVAINVIPIMFLIMIIYLLYRLKTINHNYARTLIITTTLGNLVYLGFSVVSKTVGKEAIGIAAIVSGIQNITIFSFGIFIMNSICEYDKCSKIILSKAIKNPILISSIAGILGNLINLKPSSVLESIFKEISSSTIPLSLFTIGIGLYGKKVSFINIKKILLISFFKMILLPLIVFLWIYFTQETNIEYKIIFIQYTMPTAIASYVIATEMDLEKDVVAQTIVFTTILYFMFYSLYFRTINLLF